MTVRFPWRTMSEPLVFRIVEISVDGQAVDPDLIDTDHHRVHLDGLGDWSELRLAVTAESEEEAAEEFDGASAYVMVECGVTNVRVPVALTGDPWAGFVELTRGEVEQRFVLRAEVAASVDDRLRIVGASPEWTVVMDSAAAPLPSGMPPFETVWVDFRTFEAPEAARRTPNGYAYMDLEGAPRLLLNSGVDGFQHILHADTAKEERRRLRDLLGADVARYALSAMFRAAAAEVVLEDDGTVTSPESPLFRQVCEAVAERTPGVGSVDELYERLARTRDSVAEALEIWGAVDLAISELTGVTAAVGKACAEVKHG